LARAWREWGYNDSGWLSGPAQLGYGDNDEMTPIDDGPDANRYPTYYFRREFTLTSPFDTVQPQFEILRDDAAAIYVNGVEIYRDSEPYAAGGPQPLPRRLRQSATRRFRSGHSDENAFRATNTGGAPLSFSRSLLYEGTQCRRGRGASVWCQWRGQQQRRELRLQTSSGTAASLACSRTIPTLTVTF
jgi:hypothetical protein